MMIKACCQIRVRCIAPHFGSHSEQCPLSRVTVGWRLCTHAARVLQTRILAVGSHPSPGRHVLARRDVSEHGSGRELESSRDQCYCANRRAASQSTVLRTAVDDGVVDFGLFSCISCLAAWQEPIEPGRWSSAASSPSGGTVSLRLDLESVFGVVSLLLALSVV